MSNICYIPKDCYVFDVKIKAGDTDKVHTVGYKLPSLIQELWFTKETPKEVVKHEITYRVNRMIDTLYEELEKESK